MKMLGDIIIKLFRREIQTDFHNINSFKIWLHKNINGDFTASGIFYDSCTLKLKLNL